MAGSLRLLPEPVPLIDIEVANWWTGTHPASPFVAGLIVAAQDDAGGRIALSDRDGLALTEQTPTQLVRTPVKREQLPELLASRFGLDGFALHPSGRLVRDVDL